MEKIIDRQTELLYIFFIKKQYLTKLIFMDAVLL